MFCSWVPESDIPCLDKRRTDARQALAKYRHFTSPMCTSPNPRRCQATIEIVLISLSCRDIKNKPFHREHASSLRRVIETRHTAVQHISTFTETDILRSSFCRLQLTLSTRHSNSRSFAWVPIEVQKEDPTQLGEAFVVLVRVSRSKERS